MSDAARPLAVSFFTILILILISIGLFLYAQGYRLDFTKRELAGTGILSATSIPDGSLIYLNDVPKSATNSAISNLKPGEYTVRLEKQGFLSWHKTITIRKELVTRIEALLVPLYPELKPLTYTDVQNPIASPDGQKLTFQVTQNAHNGVWLLDLTDRPFNLSNRPNLLLEDSPENLYSQAKLNWGYDSKSLLIELSDSNSLLYEFATGKVTQVDDLTILKQVWEEEIKKQQEKFLEGLESNISERIRQLPHAIWSPDNSKILYSSKNQENQEEFHVLDLNPDNTPSPTQPVEPLETLVFTSKTDHFVYLSWYPDSRHLLVLEKESPEAKHGELSLVETDGKNLSRIFTGTIIGTKVIPSLNGSKILILTSFNPDSKQYNLYSIRLH